MSYIQVPYNNKEHFMLAQKYEIYVPALGKNNI